MKIHGLITLLIPPLVWRIIDLFSYAERECNANTTRKNAIVEYLDCAKVVSKLRNNKEERFSRVPRLVLKYIKEERYSRVPRLSKERYSRVPRLSDKRYSRVPRLSDTVRYSRVPRLSDTRRYSRVPRLSDTRYSTNGTKRKWRCASTQWDQREMEICKQDKLK